MPVVVRDVAERSRYEVLVDGEPGGLLAYRLRGGGGRVQVDLVHTEVDEAYAGRGLARALAVHALDAAREAGHEVLPSCPFVAELIRRDPSYADLVPAGVRAELGLG
ncbi:N-acetyltransferase [Nocardioides lentus]|uniref:N-acetyltransferase n=1 Tax=Nocardioides lentus TaxID=338077 RepID=A0ABN2NXH8_9ACTN